MLKRIGWRRFVGFTLTEFLLTVVIICVLAAVAISNFHESCRRTNISIAKSDMRSIATAIEAYYVDNGEYPAMIAGPLSVNSIAGGDTTRVTFRLRDANDPTDHLRTMTSPIAYLTTYDNDPFAKGTVFERCFSTATATAESHMSMFTGLSPTVHGVHGASGFRGLAADVPTLAEVLRRDGFETGAVTENGAIASFRGFTRGFTSYYENKGHTSGHIEDTLRQSLDFVDRLDLTAGNPHDAENDGGRREARKQRF